jgi:hypothetical protein
MQTFAPYSDAKTAAKRIVCDMEKGSQPAGSSTDSTACFSSHPKRANSKKETSAKPAGAPASSRRIIEESETRRQDAGAPDATPSFAEVSR